MSITYYPDANELIYDVQEAGRKLLDRGINPKFVKERESGRRLSNYELCGDVIDLAKKLKARGINAKFTCCEEERLKRSVWNRNAYIRRKGAEDD